MHAEILRFLFRREDPDHGGETREDMHACFRIYLVHLLHHFFRDSIDVFMISIDANKLGPVQTSSDSRSSSFFVWCCG